MTYFKQFQKDRYPVGDNETKIVTNISQYTEIFSRLVDDTSFYTYYNHRPDERYDNISYELYGTSDYYWTRPLLNNGIINTWKDSTKTPQALEEFLKKKYPGVAIKIDPVDDVIGNFSIGEIVAYDIDHIYRVINKYPTFGYLQCIPIDSNEFDVLNDLEEVWVLLTGLWNEDNRNLYDDDNIWRDTTNYVVGKDSLASVKVESVTPAYKAPAYHLDLEENRVPWYKGVRTVTIEDVEREQNEESAKLKVIRPEYIYDIAAQFENEMART